MRYVISMLLVFVATKTGLFAAYFKLPMLCITAQQRSLRSLRRKPSDPVCVAAFVPPDLTHGTSDGPRRLITLGHEEPTFSGPFNLPYSERECCPTRSCEGSVDVNPPLIVCALVYTPSCHPHFRDTQGLRLYLDA